MDTRNGFTAENGLIRLFNGVHAGLVLFGVLLFGVGIVLSLATSGAIDPGGPSIGGDDTDADDSLESGDDTDDAADGDDSDDEGEDGTADESEATDDDTDSADGESGDDGADDTGAADDEDTDDADDTGDASEPETALLSLTVVGPAGEPLEGVTVTGQGEEHEADIPLEFEGETDEDGTYTDEIYENEYTIELEHPDYETETVEHDHDGEQELTVELEPAEDGDAPDTSVVTLTVVDEDGEPIEGASVYGEGEEHEADIPLEFEGETDEDGQYVDEIYENEYTIHVDHPEYESLTGSYTHDGDNEVVAELESED